MQGAGICSESCEAACHPQGALGLRAWVNTGDGFAPEPAGIPGSRGEGHLAPADLLS